MIDKLKPVSKMLVYELVSQVGLDTSDWANYSGTNPARNPRYCYNWSFESEDRIVLCLWFQDMKDDGSAIFQELNCRAIASSAHPLSSSQRKRARDMDHAIQLARLKKLPIRVIVVDGSRRNDADDEGRSHVERRLLDPEPWHVADYDADGNCRLQRGLMPEASESFTREEIMAAGTYAEGAIGEANFKTRKRCARLRDLAREHFARESPDGRLRCTVCDWAAPVCLPLNGPIVEIHHERCISQYPDDGTALSFEEAITQLVPVCPNCHRLIHSKLNGGTFLLEEIGAALRQPVSCEGRGLGAI